MFKDYMVRHWLHKGANPSQIILGAALFARSFKLVDPEDFQTGSRADGDGYAGRWTKTPGYLSYYEVCDRVKQDDWRQYSDKSGSPFIVRKDQWISYENHNSLTKKVNDNYPCVYISFKIIRLCSSIQIFSSSTWKSSR